MFLLANGIEMVNELLFLSIQNVCKAKKPHHEARLFLFRIIVFN